MSIVPERRDSDQGMDPEKRAAEAIESGPIESTKRLRVTSPVGQVGCVGEDEGNDLTPVQKHRHSDEPLSEILAILISDKAAQVAGDSCTRIIKEKPEFAGDDFIPSIQENISSDMLAYCFVCKKVTDHIPILCPSEPRLPDYCLVCGKECGHDTLDCPNATEDLLKKLAYCMLCDKNTNHNTFNCPDKETGFVLRPNGAYVPNICCFCQNRGHVGAECHVLSDFDDYDSPDSDENW